MSTTVPMIAQLRQEFETLLADLTGPATNQLHADEVELQLFRRLLTLGNQLLQFHLDWRAAQRPDEPVHSPTGVPVRLHDRRKRRYVSLFGEVSIRRHAYHAPGQPMVFPLDAELSLPTRCYSMVLREWAAYGATDGSYREIQRVLERVLGISLSVQMLEQCLAEDAHDVLAFDAQTEPPVADPAATILVAQADGKGVPIVQPRTTPPQIRPSSGRPANKLKEATVTAAYTIAPYPRTPDEIVDALLGPEHVVDPASEPEHPAPALRPRPRPVGKQVRATMAGKQVGVQRLAEQVRRRERPAITERVLLCDGAEALQNELRAALPDHTLVLDIIHASEYLWDAANGLLGERHPDRLDWMRTQLTLVLAGQTGQVIATLEAAAERDDASERCRQAVQRTIRYYRRNAPWMRYDEYLRRGWPIGTGVVESACGHLVKDRLQQSGMRWTLAGAQRMLDLRGVRVSGEWDAHWAYHRRQQHVRRYGDASAPAPLPLETHGTAQHLAA